ncbi:hypothetical protein [Nocardia callitridis]|uniref:SH3 domain-containing protein n=1 Tax=Nocardia callitridis TaxID=648753 RepID=A0ABP9K137_9NOCA
MSKKALTIAVAAVGVALSFPGIAGAAPNGDPAAYAEFTADFVPANTQEALNATANGKALILSPYGTSHTIACRGTGVADFYECMQEDDLGWITLNKVDVPGIGPTWTYFP